MTNAEENYEAWCCEKRSKCNWQGFALHQGLAWGSIPPATDPWRQWHDRECGGKLIRLRRPHDRHQ